MNNIDNKIQKLIKKEGLNNPEIYFADYDTFEEIPLFSRWNDISFLSHLSFDERNKILLKNTINLVMKNAKLAEDMIGKVQSADYLACITLTGWDDAKEVGSLRPNILLTRRKKWLLSNLNLKESNFLEENLTRDYLTSISASEFSALTSDGFKKNKRVYVIAN